VEEFPPSIFEHVFSKSLFGDGGTSLIDPGASAFLLQQASPFSPLPRESETRSTIPASDRASPGRYSSSSDHDAPGIIGRGPFSSGSPSPAEDRPFRPLYEAPSPDRILFPPSLRREFPLCAAVFFTRIFRRSADPSEQMTVLMVFPRRWSPRDA